MKKAEKKIVEKNNSAGSKIFLRFKNIVSYFTTDKEMFLVGVLILLVTFISLFQLVQMKKRIIPGSGSETSEKKEYWLLLHRKSNIEKLFLGEPGDQERSGVVKMFNVKVGIPGERPTPLPQLLGRKYWIIDDKFDASQYPETAPYFLKLDVPVTDEYPFCPVPYNECEGGQCNWELPGSFGLHGINGDSSRLSVDNPGSSGCIRHNDEDITYLYKLINPEDKVRYYIEDN